MNFKELKNEVKQLEKELTQAGLTTKGIEGAIKTVSEMIPRGQTFTNFHVAYGIVINTSTLVQNIVDNAKDHPTSIVVAQLTREQIESIVKYAGKADGVVKQGIKPGKKVIRIIKKTLRKYFKYLYKNNKKVLLGDDDLKIELSVR